MTESSAETLRRAANLMRERAKLVPSAPWYSAVHDVTTYDGLDVIASSGLTVRAAYVASWHPGVALAVADLLDKLAWMGELDPDLLSRVGCDEAITIARAYLEEPARPRSFTRFPPESGMDDQAAEDNGIIG